MEILLVAARSMKLDLERAAEINEPKLGREVSVLRGCTRAR